MAIASGIGGQLIAQQEATFGVAPSFSGYKSYEFKSETLELKKTAVQGQGLHAGGQYDRSGRRVVTNFDVSGGVTMDLQTRSLNLLLFNMLGSFGQAKATLTSNGDSTFTAVHAPGSMLGHSLCFQKGVPAVDTGTTLPFTYVGCKISDFEISVATGAIAELALTIDGRNELAGAGNSDPLNVSVPTLQTWNNVSQDVFHFREASLILGGTPSTTAGVTSIAGGTVAGNVKSANVKQTIALDNSRYFLSTKGFKAEQIENNFRKISGQFVIEWLSSEAQYNAFTADTATALQLNFVGPGIGSGSNTETLDILIPNVKLDGESPKIPGPAVVTQTVPFTGLDDETNNVIQFTYTTLDNS